MFSEFDLLMTEVIRLHETRAFHKRRGFCMHDAPAELISCHLLEETVELQEQVIIRNLEGIADEAADMMVVFCHLMYVNRLNPSDIAMRARQKLKDNFVTNPADVTAREPGFTRKGRA